MVGARVDQREKQPVRRFMGFQSILLTFYSTRFLASHFIFFVCLAYLPHIRNDMALPTCGGDTGIISSAPILAKQHTCPQPHEFYSRLLHFIFSTAQLPIFFFSEGWIIGACTLQAGLVNKYLGPASPTTGQGLSTFLLFSLPFSYSFFPWVESSRGLGLGLDYDGNCPPYGQEGPTTIRYG